METKDKIKEYITELGISQSKLAELSDLSFGTVNRILNGKQKLMPNTLAKIANALGLSISDLLDERVGAFNYTVQGYLQFENEITHITSFGQLESWIKKYEPLINGLPKDTDKTISVKHKTIIFDFDGTLLNTRAWQQYEHLFKAHKQGTDEWKRGRKEYLSHVKDCKKWEQMDEVINYIRQHKIPACIVTANTQDRVLEASKFFGWQDIFNKDNILGCYSINKRQCASKDSLMRKALEVLNVEANNCVAFGNELADKQAAQSIGIEAYNCLWGAPEEEKEIMSKDEASTLKNPSEIIGVLKSKVGVK